MTEILFTLVEQTQTRLRSHRLWNRRTFAQRRPKIVSELQLTLTMSHYSQQLQQRRSGSERLPRRTENYCTRRFSDDTRRSEMGTRHPTCNVFGLHVDGCSTSFFVPCCLSSCPSCFPAFFSPNENRSSFIIQIPTFVHPHQRQVGGTG